MPAIITSRLTRQPSFSPIETCAPVTQFARRCCLCNGGAQLPRASMATGFLIMSQVICNHCGEIYNPARKIHKPRGAMYRCFCLRKWYYILRILACRSADDDDCWVWKWAASKKSQGTWNPIFYGAARVKYGNDFIVGAHRVSYFLFRGPLLDGMTIDHMCRNTLCVNPSHLRQVPHRINILAGVGPAALNAEKTYCSKGHEFNERNTYHASDGRRRCKMCNRLWMRAARGK